MKVLTQIIADVTVITPLIVEGKVNAPFVIPVTFALGAPPSNDAGHKYITIDPVTQKVTFNPVLE